MDSAENKTFVEKKEIMRTSSKSDSFNGTKMIEVAKNILKKIPQINEPGDEDKNLAASTQKLTIESFMTFIWCRLLYSLI